MADVDESGPATATRVARGYVEARGHRHSYLAAGAAPDAPVVVLLHGLASDAQTWDRVLVPLADLGLRPIALDLIGHGRSDKPAASYELDDLALSVRDVMAALDVDSATICGHSLGGAVAMALAHLAPERCERLVLVSAGGLGREVHPLLRAASLAPAPAVLRALTRPGLRRLYAHPALHRALRLTPDNLTNLRRAGRALGSPEGQGSFFAALRAVIEPSGQRGSFIDMGLLARELPTMLIWNERDPVIPVAHARAAAAHLPGSRLVVFDGSGHEPHRREAMRLAHEIATFIHLK